MIEPDDEPNYPSPVIDIATRFRDEQARRRALYGHRTTIPLMDRWLWDRQADRLKLWSMVIQMRELTPEDQMVFATMMIHRPGWAPSSMSYLARVTSISNTAMSRRMARFAAANMVVNLGDERHPDLALNPHPHQWDVRQVARLRRQFNAKKPRRYRAKTGPGRGNS